MQRCAALAARVEADLRACSLRGGPTVVKGARSPVEYHETQLWVNHQVPSLTGITFDIWLPARQVCSHGSEKR